MNMKRVITALVLGLFSLSMAQAADAERTASASFYVAFNFGDSKADSASKFGLALNFDPNSLNAIHHERLTRPHFLDLSFNQNGFGSVHLNGVDVIETHRVIKAAGGKTSATWWAIGTAIGTTVALAASNSGSDNPGSTQGNGDNNDGGDNTNVNTGGLGGVGDTVGDVVGGVGDAVGGVGDAIGGVGDAIGGDVGDAVGGVGDAVGGVGDAVGGVGDAVGDTLGGLF